MCGYIKKKIAIEPIKNYFSKKNHTVHTIKVFRTIIKYYLLCWIIFYMQQSKLQIKALKSIDNAMLWFILYIKLIRYTHNFCILTFFRQNYVLRLYYSIKWYRLLEFKDFILISIQCDIYITYTFTVVWILKKIIFLYVKRKKNNLLFASVYFQFPWIKHVKILFCKEKCVLPKFDTSIC